MAKETFLILIPGFPANEQDTCCLPTQQVFVRTLNRMYPDFQVTIIATHYPETDCPYEWAGNKVIPLNGKQFGKTLSPWVLKRILEMLRRINRHNKIYGILSCWFTGAAWVAHYFAKKENIPHYCWISGQDARKNNLWLRWIKPPGSELIAMSYFLSQELFENHTLRPVTIIPNGIDGSMFPPMTLDRSIDVLGAGSLISLKRFSLFIEVILELKKDFPGIRAEILGKGREKENLARQIERQGLADNVMLRDEVPHLRVLATMQRSKILLHPSEFEGYSAVCLEALYAGCQVVSCIAAEERPVDGWHIADSVSSMTEKCKRILESAEVSYSSKIVHRMEESASSMIKIFEDRKRNP